MNTTGQTATVWFTTKGRGVIPLWLRKLCQWWAEYKAEEKALEKAKDVRHGS